MTYRNENGKPNPFAYVMTFLQAVVIAIGGYLIYRIDRNTDAIMQATINQAGMQANQRNMEKNQSDIKETVKGLEDLVYKHIKDMEKYLK